MEITQEKINKKYSEFLISNQKFIILQWVKNYLKNNKNFQRYLYKEHQLLAVFTNKIL